MGGKKPGTIPTAHEILYENRFLIFLLSIILLLLAFPLADQAGYGESVLKLPFTLVIFSGIHAMQRNRVILVLGIIIGIPAIVARWIVSDLPFNSSELYVLIFSILFFSLLCLFILSRVLGEDRITRDTIFGAIGIYLCLGITWALSYQFVEILIRGALSNVPNETAYVYFSFVTLTTLGYGDITPLIPVTESMAIFEAVIGQLYLAILIARLVSSLKR
ncbi:MAG: ion channel [Methanomicrobiaceae archaeon]|nr:ion channel [Methanomicrobiaceae archaeon]